MNNGLMDGNKMDQRPSSSVIASSTTTLKTLKGLFDEPKMNHRRDFLRENKLSLKELQRATVGKILHSKQEEEKRTPWRKTQTKTHEISANVRRSYSHQRVSGNDENHHNHQHLPGGCCGGDKNYPNDNYRRSRSHIQNTRNDCSTTMVKRNGYDRNRECHCCCGSTQSFPTGNNKTSNIQLRDQEIQTEDIYDEQFLYEALKRCSTNDVKKKLLDTEVENRICGGDDTASICEQSVHQYSEHNIPPHSNNNYSSHCPSERALSQHNLQLNDNSADVKSTRSYRTSDNVSIHSRINGGGSKCGGGDNLDNKSLNTIYASDNNRNRGRYNQLADDDNVSHCSSKSTVHSHRSKLNIDADNNHCHHRQLGSARSQQEREHLATDYQMNGGGDGNISIHPNEYPVEGPPSHRSHHSSTSQTSKKTASRGATGGSTPKSGGRDEVREVRLPRYLEKEKRAKEEERERQANRDLNCPFGHYAMDDDLRVQHLIKAQRRMDELIQELNRMPMTTETLRLRARKREIEIELQQIEADIRVYSKPKVYLPIPTNSTTKYEYYNNYAPTTN